MHKLANAIVLTSQGIPFLHAGVEMMRTKGGDHNSYNKPDLINSINWHWKQKNKDVFNYYKALISLRKVHPAFYMPTAEMVREKLNFRRTSNGLVSFEIVDNANNDRWSKILVVYNAKPKKIQFELTGRWWLAAIGSKVDEKGIRQVSDFVKIPPSSMLIAFQK